MISSIFTRYAMALALAAIVLVLPSAGCGSSEIPRLAVTGTVTLDDKPIDDGTILFTPMAAGPSAGSEIKNGRYQILRSRGPSPGKYRVDIRAYRAIGPATRDEVSGQTEQPMKQVLPPRYNSDSKLEVTLVEDRADPVDFRLQSR